MKMGLQAGLMVPDVVGIVNVMPSRSDLTQEGGGSVGMVILVGGCDMLALHITLWVGSEDADGAAPYMIGLRPKASSTSIAQSSCGGVGGVL